MTPPDLRVLQIWALGTGLLLWVPAWAVPLVPVPVQPLDLWVLVGLPIGLLHLPRRGAAFGWIALGLIASLILSFATQKGEVLVLVHGLCLALGFLMTTAAVAGDAGARRQLIQGILIGAALSALLFVVQYLFGAQRFDFRTNLSFSLPEQYRRGFALFPEVSTFAVHGGIALAMVLTLVLNVPASHHRGRLIGLALGLVAVLMLSRATSFLVVTPILCLIAIALARRLDLGAILQLGLAAALVFALMGLFFTQFYADRMETASASRSAAMRLASVLGGLSPLWSGELFGVGLGQNHEITRRAFDIGRALDLSFGQLPRGVNSQIVARIFEEGWPAVLNIAIGLLVLFRALRLPGKDATARALCILAVGSFLEALLVTGYRGIYTNWFWLALPAGLLSPPRKAGILDLPWPGQTPVLRRTAPTVLQRINTSSASPARKA